MLPPKVHEKNGRYYYVHKNKWNPLCRVDEGATALYAALQQFTSERPATYGQLMNLYIARAVPKLREASRPEYVRIINARLQHHFGHMILNTMLQNHIAEYLQMREDGGAPVGGNRERAVLGSVISWGMRFGWCSFNPCHGVRRNPERKSSVYVEDADLKAVLDVAGYELGNLLAVAYLIGLRQTDLRLMTRDQVTDRGIMVTQSKDQKPRLIEWSPTLRYFIDRALMPYDASSEAKRETLQTLAEIPKGARTQAVAALAAKHGVTPSAVYFWWKSRGKTSAAAQRRAECPFVFVGPSGRPLTLSSIQTAMKRLRAKYPGVAQFRFRDLRPKAATDAKHNVLGHSAQMLNTYIRRLKIQPVKATWLQPPLSRRASSSKS